MYLHHVAFLPFSFQREIAFLYLALHLLSVHLYRVARLLVVVKGVEIARHHFVSHPTGYSYLHLKVLGLGRYYLDGYIALPRILGLLLEHHLLTSYPDVSSVAEEEVDKKGVVFHTIDIARHRRNEA